MLNPDWTVGLLLADGKLTDEAVGIERKAALEKTAIELKYFEPAAVSATYTNSDSAGAPPSGVYMSPNGIAEIATSFANGKIVSSGLLVVILLNQDEADVALTKEYLSILRKAVPHQRILWVLAADSVDNKIPASVAKALNEAGEEWLRPYYQGALTAAGRVARSSSMQQATDRLNSYGI